MWCTFSHVTLNILRQHHPRTPPSGRAEFHLLSGFKRCQLMRDLLYLIVNVWHYLMILIISTLFDGKKRSGGAYRGTSLIRNSNPLWDHHRALGVGLLQGPRGGRFLMSEVPWRGEWGEWSRARARPSGTTSSSFSP